MDVETPRLQKGLFHPCEDCTYRKGPSHLHEPCLSCNTQVSLPSAYLGPSKVKELEDENKRPKDLLAAYGEKCE